MRPTLRDLAKASGVSMATLDRVLNGRAGVRPETIKKVNATIEIIGYRRNIQAANLARNKSYRFEFIIPDVKGCFLSELVSEITEADAYYASEMISARVRQLPVNDPHQVANYLSSISENDLDGVAIMAPEAPQIRDAIARLTERGIKAVQFLSGKPKGLDIDFVGINNHAAGATAGALIGRFAKKTEGEVLVVSESMQSRDAIERRLGFDKIIATEFPNLKPLPSLETYNSPARTERIIQQSLESHPNVKAAYIMNSEAELPVAAMQNHLCDEEVVVIAHERTSFTERALDSGQLDAIINQHAGHAVRSAIRIMRARSENREPTSSQETIRIEILLKQNL